MELIQKTKFISLALVAILALSACESSKAGDKTDLNNYILLNLLNRDPANGDVRKYCQEAVYYMNECIGASTGFNPAVMCSDSNLNTGTTASLPGVTPVVVAATALENYVALVKCVRTQVAATNCNFPQNRVGHPIQARNSFFSSCDTPKGIIITVY
jgi:hypothetical protein